MKNLENKLLELKDEKVDIPESVLNKVEAAFNEIRNDKVGSGEIGSDKIHKNKSKNFYRKKAAAIAAGVLIFIAVGSLTPIKAAVEKLIFSFNSKGIEKAVKNDYLQSELNEKLVAEDFEMEMNNILVDSSKVALDFNIVVKDKLGKELRKAKNLEAYSEISLINENGDVISKEGAKSVAGGCEYILDKSNLDNNVLNLKVLFSSSAATIPKSKKLNIDVESLVFRSLDSDKVVYSDDLKWNFSVSLDSKFINQATIDYTFTSNSNIKVNKATALPTGMYLDYDYFAAGHDENVLIFSKIVDKSGKKYSASGMTMEALKNGGSNCKLVFNGITSFDAADKFTLDIENPDGVTIDKVYFNKK